MFYRLIIIFERNKKELIIEKTTAKREPKTGKMLNHN